MFFDTLTIITLVIAGVLAGIGLATRNNASFIIAFLFVAGRVYVKETDFQLLRAVGLGSVVDPNGYYDWVMMMMVGIVLGVLVSFVLRPPREGG